MQKVFDFRRVGRRYSSDEAFAHTRARAWNSATARVPSGTEGTPAYARLKWFNVSKGFGFATLDDGSGDAFLHIGVLRAAGRDDLQPGTTLHVNIVEHPKGRQVAAILAIDESTATADWHPTAAPPRTGPSRDSVDLTNTREALGTVKWFNRNKGFGFATPDDGAADVFIHAKTLYRIGRRELLEGQRVSMHVLDTAKGRTAVLVNLSE
jgi:CspA family cold shock protein